jgi:hypothetical protein
MTKRDDKLAELKSSLYLTDMEAIRIVEDVVDVLLRRGIISLRDLQEITRVKLEHRKNLRLEIQRLQELPEED